MEKKRIYLRPEDKLIRALKNTDNAVAFTGAGVSVPSGIPDFRSATGLYSTKYGDFDPEDILSRDFFDAHPSEFFRFYREKMVYKDAQPNAAHHMLAKLEEMGILKAVITQNIDGLHTAAGNKNVYELHGSVHRNYCMRCGKSYDLDAILDAEDIPRCECGGIIKPDVVLYGENLDGDMMAEAARIIRRADVMIIMGTSLKVYPAAGLVYEFGGNFCAVVNKSISHYGGVVDAYLNYDCSTVGKYVLRNLEQPDKAAD